VLPAVLAIENNADQRRFMVRNRGADVVQMLHEIVRRVAAVRTLVVEADHVAQGMIAEDDAQLMAALRDPIRLVQHSGLRTCPRPSRLT
jgi:hypothetical protein